MNGRGRSLELFFVDGDPNGLQTAEMFNWTGHVLKTPRTQIKDALSRKEAKYTGVYVLLGHEDEKVKAYIGESDNVARRVSQHVLEKDWWTEAVFIVSASNNLHKAHAAYLEMRLIDTAQEAGRVILDNSKSGMSPSLPEAATANMEAFLDSLFVVLPAIKVDIFEQRVRTSSVAEDRSGKLKKPYFELFQKKDGIKAQAYLDGSDFVVEAGSQTREKWAGAHASYRNLRQELEDIGVIGVQDNKAQFLKSYVFNSPSAAAAVILGRSSNGTLEWKEVESGMSYKDWEAKQLNSAAE